MKLILPEIVYDKITDQKVNGDNFL